MLKSLVSSLVSGEVKELTSRVSSAAILYVLAGLCAVVGVAFLVGAGFVLVAERYGTIEATLGFGLGFLVVAVLLLVVNSMQAKAWKRRREEARAGEVKALAIAALLGAVPGLLKTRGGLAGILVPIIGLVALKIVDENRGDGGKDEES
ncbi:MAG: hypothetical protein R3D45_12680 [Rhizobiaceae bacterium]